MRLARACLTVAMCGLSLQATAGDVRERTRLKGAGASVSAEQAQDVTLTVSPIQRRALQSVLRTAGILSAPQSVNAEVCAEAMHTLRVGQRVRVFPVSARSSMYQGRVARVQTDERCATLQVELAGRIAHPARHYMMEVLIDHGQRLCIPNEAIIEEEARRIVYIRRDSQTFEPREITAGLQGETYTEVLSGLKADELVVTIGSFFVDSEFKMKQGR